MSNVRRVGWEQSGAEVADGELEAARNRLMELDDYVFEDIDIRALIEQCWLINPQVDHFRCFDLDLF